MRKSILYIAFFLVVPFLSAFCFLPDWLYIESKNCKVLFPNIPKQDSVVKRFPDGVLTMHIYTYEPTENSLDSNLRYDFFEINYPAKYFSVKSKLAEDSFYTGVVKGSLEQVKGKLISFKNIIINGKSGREMTIGYLNGQATMTSRMILINNTLLNLQLYSESGKEKNENALKFLNSLQLK